MDDVPTEEMRTHLAERRTALREVTDATPTEALKLWPPPAKDWGVLAAFASKPALPPKLYESLHERGSWFLSAVLCGNPHLPLDLLYCMAQLRQEDSIPRTVDDLQQEDYRPDAIKYLARAALRRRLRL